LEDYGEARYCRRARSNRKESVLAMTVALVAHRALVEGGCIALAVACGSPTKYASQYATWIRSFGLDWAKDLVRSRSVASDCTQS